MRQVHASSSWPPPHTRHWTTTIGDPRRAGGIASMPADARNGRRMLAPRDEESESSCVVAYLSSTNRRLRNSFRAQSIAEESVSSLPPSIIPSASDDVPYRVVLGLGPGRSGTKSLSELLAAQRSCVHSEHEMIVPRTYRRDPSGRMDVGGLMNNARVERDDRTGPTSATSTPISDNNNQKQKKGSWGADRRLEWDAPRLARGAAQRTEEEEATYRIMRLLEQREAFKGWIRDANANKTNGCTKAITDGSVEDKKPRKLGARGWREHNDNTTGSASGNITTRCPALSELSQIASPVVAAVSSAGLAYVHEHIALDPTIRVVVLMRPREEVVMSFLKKSRGRNHWQRHRSRSASSSSSPSGETVQKDKTWDSAFPNMSDDECRPFVSSVGATETPDKCSAIRAYWELYNDVALELSERYSENVRVFDMVSALNGTSVQEDMLRWCGFDDPVLDTSESVHLNKKKLR